MNKFDLINDIQHIIYTNYKVNLSESKLDQLNNKIEQLKSEYLSGLAIETLHNLLINIESHLKSGTNQNLVFDRLFNRLIQADTESVRNETIDTILNFNDLLTLQSFDKICRKYGNFKLSVLLENNNHAFSIFAINYDEKKIHNIDGFVSVELKIQCEDNFIFDNRNISALYGSKEMNKKTVEVFMVSNDLLKSEDEEMIELIIFHEICHYLEKTSSYRNLNLDFSQDEILVGKKIHSIANRVDEMLYGWGKDKDHNELFGTILFHFIKNYDYDRRYGLTSKAMIKNFLEDVSRDLEIASNLA